MLLLCLPASKKALSINSAVHDAELRPTASLAGPVGVHLSRAQRDVVHSAVEFLAGRAACRAVVLRGVAANSTASTAPTAATTPTTPGTATTTATATTASPSPRGGLLGNSHTEGSVCCHFSYHFESFKCNKL